MNVIDILKEAFDGLKRNPVLAVPSLIAVLFVFFLTLIVIGGSVAIGAFSGGLESPGMAQAMMGFAGGIFVVTILSALVSLFAHGMTVFMARDVADTGTTTFKGGLDNALGRLVDLILAAVLVALAVGIGFMVLFVPGLIAGFFLMFTFPAIAVEGLSAVGAIKRSIEIVRGRLSEALAVFGVIVGLLVGFFVVNALIGLIPLLGQLASLALSAGFGAYLALVLVLAFRGLASGPVPAGPGPVAPPPPPPGPEPPPPPPPPTAG